MAVPFTFGLVEKEKRIQQYKIFFMKNDMDLGRHIKKRTQGIDNLRKAVVRDVLNKSYNKTAWVSTEDNKWVGHARYNARMNRYEWTDQKDWTDLHVLNRDGTLGKRIGTPRRRK